MKASTVHRLRAIASLIGAIATFVFSVGHLFGILPGVWYLSVLLIVTGVALTAVAYISIWLWVVVSTDEEMRDMPIGGLIKGNHEKND